MMDSDVRILPDSDVDITKSRWGDLTFYTRFRHFFKLTDPTNCLKGNKKLDEAQDIVKQYKSDGTMPVGGVEALWSAKYLYESAFHPETGDKQNVIGRMSFQVPGGMVITGILMAFYKSPLEVFLGQWLNQSFNALVNFTNRSGDKPLPNSVILSAYFAATSLATGASIGLNKTLAPRAPPIVGRFVPFIAVAVANMVNIPCMRSQELKEGVVIVDAEGNKLGQSVTAAQRSIVSTTFSRICIAAPGMLMTPIIMEQLEKKPAIKALSKWKNCVLQTLLVGSFLLIAVPVGCSLFAQVQSIAVDDLEDDLKKAILAKDSSLKTVYYNKGL
ncbi:sideroflexin-1-like [Bolinopsis microptera]|uniref:sideroflexin-1-like n=1 Tax=Bolinopsis microptera TaxID=2820187 RepID=UPI0030796C8A